MTRPSRYAVQVTIHGLSEQDMDLLLLVESAARPDFARWLTTQVKSWPARFRRLVSVRRSVDGPNGETDLELTFADPAGAAAQLLLENKIGAGFQPRQLKRYRQRADSLVRAGQYTKVMVALVAPGRYAPRKPREVDAWITYESIREHWCKGGFRDPRLRIAHDAVSAAIKKAETGYNPASDRPVTAFWRSYWTLASKRMPELQMPKPPAKPSGAGFVWFFPDALPGKVNVCHKLMKGFVDLHFPGWGGRVSALEQEISRLCKPDMRIVKAAKSGAVRVRVPVLYTNDSFDEQLDLVVKGQDAVKRLYDWALTNRRAIAACF